MDHRSAATPCWCEDEVQPLIAQFTGSFVALWHMPLAVAADAHPPVAGSVAPAVAAGPRREHRVVVRAELLSEEGSDRVPVQTRIFQQHGDISAGRLEDA